MLSADLNYGCKATDHKRIQQVLLKMNFQENSTHETMIKWTLTYSKKSKLIY